MESTLSFPEYHFTEFCKGSYKNRKPPTVIEVGHVSQYRSDNPNTPAWISHFRFTEDFKTYCQDTGSVSDYAGLCYSGNLWFDVDVAFAENTEEIRVAAMAKALELTKKLINMIMRGYEYPADGLRCYFTGSKGFCLSMITEAFGLEPSKDFNEECLYLVKKITALQTADDGETSSFEIDEGVYDKTRLWRIPNTPNDKIWHDQTPRYKIPLTVNEILECTDINRIIDMARKPRTIKPELLDPAEFDGELAHLMDGYSVQPQKPSPDTSTGTKKKGKHDYAAILNGKLEGTSRTDNLTYLVGHWQTRGIPKDEAIAMAQAWDHKHNLRLDDDPQYKTQYSIGKVAGTIEDLYRRNNTETEEDEKEYQNLSELQHKVHAPIKWIAEPYIPEGVTLLVGKPKLGKSWLTLNLELAVASGGKFLGTIDVEQGAVLSLDLDGNERRLKRRVDQILQGEEWPKDFFYEHKHKRGQRGIQRITNWLERVENPRLIVIDTFVKFRDLSGSRNVNIYEKDTGDLHILETLAEDYHVGIIVVHHSRKTQTDDVLDDASGSTGLGGGSNSFIGMRKDGSSRSDATLFITGHDIDEGEGEIALAFDRPTGLWRLLGDAGDYRMSEARGAIVELLKNSTEPLPGRAIAQALQKNESTTRTLLSKLVKSADIRKKDSKYTVYSVDTVDSIDTLDTVDSIDSESKLF